MLVLSSPSLTLSIYVIQCRTSVQEMVLPTLRVAPSPLLSLSGNSLSDTSRCLSSQQFWISSSWPSRAMLAGGELGTLAPALTELHFKVDIFFIEQLSFRCVLEIIEVDSGDKNRGRHTSAFCLLGSRSSESMNTLLLHHLALFCVENQKATPAS